MSTLVRRPRPGASGPVSGPRTSNARRRTSGPFRVVLALIAGLGVVARAARSRAGLLVALAALGAAPARSPCDFPDPFVLRTGTGYLAFATGSGGTHVQVARSRDLVSWTLLPDALPHLPAWASREAGLTWAPSVLARGDRFILYYTARDTASGFQCISRASSASPQGPYVDDSDRPMICPVAGETPWCGSIDPSPFVDERDRPYVLWKSDENSAACHAAPRIWAQPMTDDGLALAGPAAPLLTMDRAWERPIIEGPSMLQHDGVYFLFYSANWYDGASYAVGYATCTGPLGPCTKVTTDAPLLRSDATALGPGGQEFFDADGKTYMAYHAWTAPRAGYGQGGVRSLRIARVTFAGDTPVLGADGPSDLAMQ